MALRLGGWWRLWILGSACYGIVVLAVAASMWPQIPPLGTFGDSFSRFDYLGARAAGYSDREIAVALATREARQPNATDESFVHSTLSLALDLLYACHGVDDRNTPAPPNTTSSAGNQATSAVAQLSDAELMTYLLAALGETPIATNQRDAMQQAFAARTGANILEVDAACYGGILDPDKPPRPGVVNAAIWAASKHMGNAMIDALPDVSSNRAGDEAPPHLIRSASELRDQRLRFGLTVLGVWLAPCLVLLAIGAAVRWVYVGFKAGDA